MRSLITSGFPSQRDSNADIKWFSFLKAWINCLTNSTFTSVSDCIIRDSCKISNHDDVIKWKHFPRNWPFVRRIHRSPVNSPHKGQWHGALMFYVICVWINGWVNNREAGDLRRYRSHYDVIVMSCDVIANVFLIVSKHFFSTFSLNPLIIFQDKYPYWRILCRVGNSHRSASPRPTTLEEDQELFVDFSSILCLRFEIQAMRTYNFFDWVSNTDTMWQKWPAEVIMMIVLSSPEISRL